MDRWGDGGINNAQAVSAEKSFEFNIQFVIVWSILSEIDCFIFNVFVCQRFVDLDFSLPRLDLAWRST